VVKLVVSKDQIVDILELCLYDGLSWISLLSNFNHAFRNLRFYVTSECVLAIHLSSSRPNVSPLCARHTRRLSFNMNLYPPFIRSSREGVANSSSYNDLEDTDESMEEYLRR
jgi:hypothetical protein